MKQPVDLEHAGLVAALHERLAAVEGRANIKTKVLADDDISLPLNKETMLYYIAQEALNNIMKHANATSVTILLKNLKTLVKLEVLDDGCGFQSQTFNRQRRYGIEDHAGTGLPNWMVK